MAWPAGVVAMPVTVNSVVPALPAVNEMAARMPAPEAPVRADGRDSATSMRPADALTDGTNVTMTPPCIMNDPCVTVGARTMAGS